MISNWEVFDLKNCIKASKYPMQTDTEACTTNVTPTVLHLASSPAGSGHDQFLTGIRVSFDLKMTVKAWVEAERYKFLDFVSSQSTMHRLLAFDLGTSYIEYVDRRIIAIMQELKRKADATGDQADWLRLIYSNPCGFQLTARMSTNYRALKTIYAQRKNHRLPEWREFCKWIESLPYAEDFITKGSVR